MGSETSGAGVYLYVISCGLERVKIGVADDPAKRLRELQVGSPAELKLMLTRPYAERRDAEAVAAELYWCFGGRRVRGSWYRLTAAELREGLGRRATLEAPARAAAAVAAHERPLAPRKRKRPRARTQKQLAYQRRRRQERTRKQKRAAKLLGQGMTQQAVAAELGVTSRTLRNWKTALAFQRERERQHKHSARLQTAPPSGKVKSRARRDPQDTRRDRAGGPRPAAQPQPDLPPAPDQQQTSAEAAEQPPSGFRWVDGLPLWGDSDGWPAQRKNTPPAMPTTRLAATDPRPTASTTTPSFASAAKPRPRSTPFAAKKREAATAHAKRTTARDR